MKEVFDKSYDTFNFSNPNIRFEFGRVDGWQSEFGVAIGCATTNKVSVVLGFKDLAGVDKLRKALDRIEELLSAENKGES